MVNWKTPDSFSRLLAATVASFDGNQKLNYHKIASLYGEGATYDAIEGRFRIIKKEATKLKEELDSGDREEAPKRGSANSSNPSTPRKPKSSSKSASSGALHGVSSGRVSKQSSSFRSTSSANTTPTKRSNQQKVIKPEVLDLTGSDSYASSATSIDTPVSSMVHDTTDYYNNNDNNALSCGPASSGAAEAAAGLLNFNIGNEAYAFDDNLGFDWRDDNDYDGVA